jgi:hypothetical protein
LKTLEASKTSQISTVLTMSDHALWIKLVLLLQELSHEVPYLECLERRQLNAWNLFKAPAEWLKKWLSTGSDQFFFALSLSHSLSHYLSRSLSIYLFVCQSLSISASLFVSVSL